MKKVLSLAIFKQLAIDFGGIGYAGDIKWQVGFSESKDASAFKDLLYEEYDMQGVRIELDIPEPGYLYPTLMEAKFNQ